jgi:hypothetical protein
VPSRLANPLPHDPGRIICGRTRLNRVGRRGAAQGTARKTPGPPATACQPPLNECFNSLLSAYGPQHRWPGETQCELIVDAVLVQNTSWTNAERALTNLRAARLLEPNALGKVPLTELESLIRPSGYFRQKAHTLQSFFEFLRWEYGGSLKRMLETQAIPLRQRLLGLLGIGRKQRIPSCCMPGGAVCSWRMDI